ncbi:MAG: hypothetical protein M3139_10130 [Bacteroidota bacterium]|nr:hypothetical protein [Bacteroidota bacterium]
MNKFSPEDLVQYLYKETSEGKTQAIKDALEIDWDLHESYKQLQAAHEDLEEVVLAPREEAVNKILQHISRKEGQLYSH